MAKSKSIGSRKINKFDALVITIAFATIGSFFIAQSSASRVLNATTSFNRSFYVSYCKTNASGLTYIHAKAVKGQPGWPQYRGTHFRIKFVNGQSRAGIVAVPFGANTTVVPISSGLVDPNLTMKFEAGDGTNWNAFYDTGGWSRVGSMVTCVY